MQSEIRRNLISMQQGEHLHDYSQILIGWQGKMTCELPHFSRALSRGHFALAPNNVPHLFSGHSQDCELLVVDIHRQDPLMTYIAESSGTSLDVLLCSSSIFSQLPVELIGCLEFAAKQLQQASEDVRRRINTQMLPMVLLQVSDIVSEQDRAWRNVAHQRLDLVTLNALIDSKLDQTFTNEWLAHYFNMSESHFYVVCQKQLGMSPQKYIVSRKLQQAHELMRTTKAPISVLANQYGFSSTSSFSRAYRKLIGVSPRQIRAT
jgi:AraC family transcriptional regulator